MAEAGTELGAEAARRLAALGMVEIGPGLDAPEFERVRTLFGFDFAADHRAFLAAGLPLGARWPDWRHGDEDQLRAWLSRPVEGVLFDVRRNGYWHPSWGTRPEDPAAAQDIATRGLADAPTLVPVYAHRYLPADGGISGHPVLSVHQTDVISYGADLIEYVHREFGAPAPEAREVPRVVVGFWKDLVS